MDFSFFVRGWIIGLSIAAVVGPMCILCIQRTVQHGFRYGFISGLGIATADGCYGFLAAFGLTIVTLFLVHQQTWIRLIGGGFLLYLGIRTVLTKPASKAVETEKTGNLATAYLSTFLLTLTNPLTILSFAAIFAGIGASGGSRSSMLAPLFIVCGVFSGSVSWWLFLTGMVSLLRRSFTLVWLLWINRISGVIIIIFGFFSLAGLLNRFA
jgi:threonine/homoserine/homoserine lactone efflux protein